MLGNGSRIVVTACLLFGGVAACVSRAEPVQGDVTAFNVAISEPQLRIYSACGLGTVSVRLIEERRCLRLEYQEIHVGVPQASQWSAIGLRALGTGLSGDAEDDWPAPEPPPTQPQRRRTYERTVDDYVCQIPASGVTITIDGVEHVTDASGEVTVDRTTNRLVVTLGDDRWYTFCDP